MIPTQYFLFARVKSSVVGAFSFVDLYTIIVYLAYDGRKALFNEYSAVLLKEISF